MKNIILILCLMLSVLSFSVQKTGIKEYDSLNYKKGVFLSFYDKDGQQVKTKEESYSYRRAYKQKSKIYVIGEFYTETNTPMYIFTLKNDIEDGKFVKYHENGNIGSEGTYVNGEPDGDVTFYDEAGALIQTDVYKDGVLIDSKHVYQLMD